MPNAPKILIVEDQYFVAVDCEMSLRAAGFDCVGLAANGDEALALARAEKPDLVLMDIRLSGSSNGVDVATRLFNELGLRSIFSSGHADAVTRRQAEAAHPLGWLPKPYSGVDLIAAVKHGLDELQHNGHPDDQPTPVRNDLH